MKLIPFLAILFLTTTSFCQQKLTPVDSFLITGKINSPVSFSFHNLDSFSQATLGDITTVNHRGEVKSMRKNVKGILLKDILTKAKFDLSKPKDLNSCYFVLTGTDEYRFVFSYSEIFNSSNVYVITESDGKSWKQIEDRVAVLILTEPHKGHIAMKGLYKLMIEKAM